MVGAGADVRDAGGLEPGFVSADVALHCIVASCWNGRCV